MNSQCADRKNEAKIFIAGHNGLVGNAVYNQLLASGYENLVTQSRSELDLSNQQAVDDFFQSEQPTVVIDAAAKVGGIMANVDAPYDFLLDNLRIQNNLISSSLKYDVKKFIFLGSSCIYPKHCSQPIKEEYLLSGELEPTNEYYAIAKIAGIKACEAANKQFDKNFISLMPCNLYGPNDNFHRTNAHVIPAMIRKFHEAKLSNHSSVKLWGTGTPLREFLYVEDVAKAIQFSIEKKLSASLYNVGSGEETSIKDLANLIKKIVGFKGEIIWESSKPDGTPRKVLDSSKINSYGWNHTVNLADGISRTYKWFKENKETFRGS